MKTLSWQHCEISIFSTLYHWKSILIHIKFSFHICKTIIITCIVCAFECMVYAVHICVWAPTPEYARSESQRHLVKSSITFCRTGWRRNTSESVKLRSSSCLTASALPESLVPGLLHRSMSKYSYARLFIWVLAFKLRSSCLNNKSSYSLSHLSRSQSFFFFF